MKSPSRPFVRTPFNYDVDRASVLAGLACTDPSRAQQQFRDECDINTIVERFGLTHEIPTGTRMPSYGDFTGVSDFQTAMEAVRSATESFMALPAKLRERFANSPQNLLVFLGDPTNREEAVRLGLVEAPPIPAGTPAPPAT